MAQSFKCVRLCVSIAVFLMLTSVLGASQGLPQTTTQRPKLKILVLHGPNLNLLGRRDARRIMRDAQKQRNFATDSAPARPSRQSFEVARCNSFVGSHLTNKCDDHASEPHDASCRELGVLRLARRALGARASFVVLSTRPMLSIVARRHGELSAK